MPHPLIRQITQEAREDNPKAVFFGDYPEVVNPLAVYLSENNVDLYAGKSFHDAHFGQYFFYVGTLESVKEFLAHEGSQLPKTLLLLTDVSDKNEIEKLLAPYPQIKSVLLLGEPFLADEEPGKIVEFFFGSGKQVMLRRGERAVKVATPVSAVAEEIVEERSGAFTTQVVSTEPELSVSASASGATDSLEAGQEESAKEVVGTVPAASVEKSVEPETTERGFDNLAPPQAPKDEPSVAKPWPKEPVAAASELPASSEIPLISAQYTPNRDSDSSVGHNVGNLYKTDEPKPTGNVSPPQSRMSIAIAGLLGFVIFLSMPFVTLAITYGVSGFHLVRGKQALESLKTENAKRSFSTAVWWASAANKNIELLIPLFTLLKKEQTSQSLSQVAHLLEDLGKAGEETSDGTQNLVTVVRGITGQEKGVPFLQQITQARSSFVLAEENFGQVEAELKSDAVKSLLSQPFIKNSFTSIGALPERISELRGALNSTASFLSIAPETIGLNGERTYLVLFQNNMELRPTGGFIGSYGLLKFDGGVFNGLSVEDVYAADGKLEGHVDPPGPIASYLHNEHWYLRDSNWSANFSQSAQRAAWFLDKEEQIPVNGVIALDIAFVQKLLESTGPLTVPDLKDPVTAENLFTKAHATINSDFFPGSTVKKDYLGAVARALMEELLTNKLPLSPQFIQSLAAAVEEKHALLYFTDNNSQSVVSSLGWAGDAVKLSCVTSNCETGIEGDLISVVDANLGVNKSNFFVQRALSAEVQLSSDRILHQLTVSYKNDSPANDASVGGRYDNYVRVRLPITSEVSQVKLDNLPLTLTNSPVASAATFAAASENGLLEVGVFVEVPPQRERSLTLSYSTKVQNPGKYTYEMAVLKQPGTLSDPLALNIKYPADWQAINPGSNVAGATTLVKDAQISYNSNLQVDRFFKIPFK